MQAQSARRQLGQAALMRRQVGFVLPWTCPAAVLHACRPITSMSTLAHARAPTDVMQAHQTV